MNVALWAEIRRLAEIEKLSGRAISRRLHCSRHTVAAALELDQPPGAKSSPAPASWTPTGPRSTLCWPSIPTSRRCASTRRSLAAPMAIPAAPASSAATCGRSVPRAVASTRKFTTNRPRRCRSIGASAAACKSVPRPAKVSVFVAVLCYSRLIYIEFTLSQRKEEFYRGIVHALEFFGGSPRAIIFDNLKAAVLNGSGRAACLPSRVLGVVRLLLLAANRLRTPRPGIKGDRRGGRALREAQCPGRTWRGTDPLRGLPGVGPPVARPGRQRAAARGDPRAARGSLRAGTLAVARAAGDLLRHRRGRAGSCQPSCADRVRRQSLLSAAAVGAPASHDSRQP